MPDECWARSLNDCDTKLSREHLISEGIWEGPTIQVVGLPWCKHEPKTVGIAALTAKVLCRHHNSRLSPVDQAGINGFKALRRMAVLGTGRGKTRPRKWKLRRFEIDGWGLERWFLKTLINVTAGSTPDQEWALDGSPAHSPPDQIVRAAFGQERLEQPLGMYAAAAEGDQIEFSDRVELVTLLNTEGQLVGGLFVFTGVEFLIYLDTRPLPPTMSRPHRPGWNPKSLLYRIKRINHKVGRWHSHYIAVMW